MSYPFKLDLPHHVIGDQWQGMQFVEIKIGENEEEAAIPDEPLARVEVTFFQGDEQVCFDSADGSLTITDAAAWSAEIPAQDEFLEKAGTYAWAARFSADGWGRYTLFRGRITVELGLPEKNSD